MPLAATYNIPLKQTYQHTKSKPLLFCFVLFETDIPYCVEWADILGTIHNKSICITIYFWLTIIKMIVI